MVIFNYQQIIQDMGIKEIKAALQLKGTIFTIAGLTEHSGTLDLQKFQISEYMEGEFAFNTIGFLPRGMNIKKWGTKRFYVFDYTVLGKRVDDYVNYESVSILEVGEVDEFADEMSK